MPWLDTRNAAGHLDLSEARFLVLVKSGKFPRPSYHLGGRSPRWNSEALDSAMNPETALNVTREAFSGLVKKIEEKGGTRRHENAR
jgi:predicted DNA-binding transcriptional regulator AlpA